MIEGVVVLLLGVIAYLWSRIDGENEPHGREPELTELPSDDRDDIEKEAVQSAAVQHDANVVDVAELVERADNHRMQ